MNPLPLLPPLTLLPPRPMRPLRSSGLSRPCRFGLLEARFRPMIYICVPSHNHAATVGLLLWKVRQVFQAFPREYQFLVADDASTDGTREVLDLYQRALPVSVLRPPAREGYAASLERALRESLRRTDRPRRDCAIILPPDFTVSPEALPDLVRRLESGADLVVGELHDRRGPWLVRLVQRGAPWLLKPGLSVPGVRDLLSGCYGLRLATLKRCFRDGQALLETEGWCANAELVARTAVHARQIAAVPVAAGSAPAPSGHPRPTELALAMLRAGRQLRIPAPNAPVERMA